jgi:hypothetical protein
MASLISLKTFEEFIADNDDMSSAWGAYVKYMKNCFVACDINQVARQKVLLLIQGGKTLEDLNIADYVPPAAAPLQVETLDEYATRIGLNYPVQAQPFLQSFKLSNCQQENGETIKNWAQRLIKIARLCNYVDVLAMNRAVVDQIIKNTTLLQLRKEALRLPNQTLEQLITAASLIESVQAQITTLEQATSATIRKIDTKEVQMCENCGNSHDGLNSYCSGPTTQCYNCLNMGHYSKFCREPQRYKPNTKYSSQSSQPRYQSSYSLNQNQRNHQNDRFNTRRYSASDQNNTFNNRNRSQSNNNFKNTRPNWLNDSNRRANPSMNTQNYSSNANVRQITTENEISQSPFHQSNECMYENNDQQYFSRDEVDEIFCDMYANMYVNGQQQNTRDDIKMINSYELTNETHVLRLFNAAHSKDYVEAVALININDYESRTILDSGATVCVQPQCDYSQMLNPPELEKYLGKAYGYDDNKEIHVLGKYTARITAPSYTSSSVTTTVLVVPKGENVIDNRTSQLLGLLTINVPYERVNTIIQDGSGTNKGDNDGNSSEDEEMTPEMWRTEFKQVFRPEVGKYNKNEIALNIDYDVEPSKCKVVRIPIYQRPLVANETANLITQDLVETTPHGEPTTFVSPIVVVPKKDGSIRITINSKKANKALIREQYPMSTIDDIKTLIQGASWITKLDMRKAYSQLVIRKEDRHMTTFMTHEGTFRSKRLLNGMSPCAEIFERVVKEVLQDIKNANSLSDDIIVWGYGKKKNDHNKTLRLVLNKITEVNLTLYFEKCIFCQMEVPFYGIMISGNGTRPTEERIKALKDAVRPETQDELRSFLGVVNWNTNFILGLAQLAKPLQLLTHKNTRYVWNSEHEKAFNACKHALTTSQLKHFIKEWLTRVIVDASPIGLGAILTQINPKDTSEVNTIAYKSRNLTKAEEGYSQIEREALAVDWILQKWHLYLINNKFTVVTDNKALIAMHKKTSSVRNERVQKMIDRWPKYNMDLEYIPGMYNQADYMSRHPSKMNDAELQQVNIKEQSLNRHIKLIITEALPPMIKPQEIVKATAECKVLQEILQITHTVNRNEKLSEVTKPYKEIIDDIVYQDGMVTVYNKIILPTSLHNKAIQSAHYGHLGMTKTYDLLRLYVWFPQMKLKVEQMIKKCICQCVTAKLRRGPVLSQDIPSGPWKEAATDYKGPVDGKMILIVICKYSKYPFVKITKTTNAQEFISFMNELFAMFGFLEKIDADNGPPFNGHEVKNYFEARNIKFHHSTPLWSNANPQAEKFIKNLTKLIQSEKAANRNFLNAMPAFLLNYRSTPHRTTKVSPAMLFFNRDVRSFVPQLLVKESKTPLQIKAETYNEINQNKSNDYANQNRNVQVLNPFSQNDIVRIYRKQYINNKSESALCPDLYTIKTMFGSQCVLERLIDRQVIVRNIAQLSLVHKATEQNKQYIQANDNKPTQNKTISHSTNKNTCLLPLNPINVNPQPQPILNLNQQQVIMNQQTPPPTPFLQQIQQANYHQQQIHQNQQPPQHIIANNNQPLVQNLEESDDDDDEMGYEEAMEQQSPTHHRLITSPRPTRRSNSHSRSSSRTRQAPMTSNETDSSAATGSTSNGHGRYVSTRSGRVSIPPQALTITRAQAFGKATTPYNS